MRDARGASTYDTGEKGEEDVRRTDRAAVWGKPHAVVGA